MSATATWYFDFISPYAYLQSTRLPRFDALARIECKPVLFAGLLSHWQTKGPVETPPKRVQTYRNAVWLAHAHEIAFRLPQAHPFNPLPMLRLSIALGNARDVVDALFRFVWIDGHLPSDEAAWSELCASLGVDEPEVEIARPEVKEALRRNTEEAIGRGVFGVPTLAIEDQLFWGFDMTDAALAWLRDDPVFRGEQMKRAAALPDGLHRSLR